MNDMLTLRLKGFKCFTDGKFDLNQLTVLSGANGVGKSTIVQAILLTKIAYDGLKNTSSTSVTIPLNEAYGLSLGVYDDIVNDSIGKIELILDNCTFHIDPHDPELPGVVAIWREGDAGNWMIVFDGILHYLNAERVGPRYNYEFRYQDLDYCGDKGEQTARLLLQHYMDRVEPAKYFSGKEGNFQIQVDNWLNYIFPGISVKVESIGKRNGQIILRNNTYNQSAIATNIGFGISYALPVIVEGLLTPNSNLLIIENPEAHLHPQAQSNMGFFLGSMAAAGVRVLIETHSEHVVNGIRRATLSDIGLQPNGVSIYFFDGTKEQENAHYIQIGIESDGSLTDFPENFFDQVQQDLLTIMELADNKR